MKNTIMTTTITPRQLLDTRPELMAYLLSIGSVSFTQNWGDPAYEHIDDLDRDEDNWHLPIARPVVSSVGSIIVVTEEFLSGADFDFIKHHGFSLYSITPKGKHKLYLELQPTPVLLPNPPGAEDQQVA